MYMRQIYYKKDKLQIFTTSNNIKYYFLHIFL